MDAMMLAASVPSAFTGRLADFGAGAGAAGLAVLSRCSGARAVLVERSPEMAAFAQATLAHPDNARIACRAEVLQADVGLTGKARQETGLADNSFDHVIMNPPFNAEADRATPDELKRLAHVMEGGLFESWLRSAAAVTRPRGGVCIIARPESLGAILDAMGGRFGNAELMAIHPRPDAAAIRIVVRAVRGARGKLAIRPPLILHESGSDRFSAHTDRINNGLASLFGD
jgi:tRNA1(Val) A37 N6-methylase TrmN6